MPPRRVTKAAPSVPAPPEGDSMDKTENQILEIPALPSSPKGTKRRKQDSHMQDAAQPTSAEQQQQSRHRRSRKAGGATTSAQADATMFDADEALARRPSIPKHKGPAAAAGPGGNSADSDSPYEAVVKVFVIHCEPNFSLPWQRKRQYSSGSSGFIIPGRRILTNAHCVADHTQVKVKRRGSDTKFVASVLAVATEGDMALLTVEDDDFWKGSEPVQFGSLPQLQDAVTVVGYPIGGDTMSVTSGVVSRIEVTSYVHGAAELLGIQIDAAINSGNSGGPAFNDQGECVGIAFQSLKHEDAENIGYIIPTPVVQHFIQDYEKNGSYTGFPCLGIEWQKLENPDLRSVLDMRSDQKGVMIRRIEPTASASKVLETGDVLLSFDGVPIANDGTVPFRSGERIGFSYLISQKYVNEKATLQILKKGKEVTVNIQLAAPVRLVPYHTKGQPPSYFIIAGLVFTQVTVPYLKSEYGKEYDYDAPVRLLEKMMHAMAQTAEQQVVVLGQVLAADVNIGYEEIINTQVLQLNGQRINNLQDLVQMVDSCTADYLDFDLDYNQKVVLHTAQAKKATQEILAMHCISQDRSSNLLIGEQAAATAAVVVAEAELVTNAEQDRKQTNMGRKQSGRQAKAGGKSTGGLS